MCYDIKASYEAQLKRAQRRGDQNVIAEIKQILLPLTDLPLFHVSGFSHPRLLIYTAQKPYQPEIANWGLIPDWISDEKQAKLIWNKTLNARAETIFNKPSFKASANGGRCLIFIDGFFEHHYHVKKSYPYYIHQVSDEPIALAGLWSEWLNRENSELVRTFTIVTTEANAFMSKIHNNPKLKQARMPLMLPIKFEDEWLEKISDGNKMAKFITEINSGAQDHLSAHTVGKLRGKKYVGNIESVTNPYIYQELASKEDDLAGETLTLF